MTEKKPVTEKKTKAPKDQADKKPSKKKIEEKRSGISFQPLRHALQPVMKQAAPKGVTGHYLQLLTLWPELTAKGSAKGSYLHKLTFPKGSQQGATLHLHVRDSSQALLLSYEKTNLQAKINQAFGYALINDIKVMAVPTTKSGL
ncbi:MAG TPA: DUF721 domain-containing protein [Alphaproteobacteria bacterium]